MKKCYILLTLILLSLNCFSREIDLNKLKRNGMIHTYEGKVLNGKAVIKTDETVIIFQFKNGLKHGLQEHFLIVNGKKRLIISSNTKDGLGHGENKRFFENGQLSRLRIFHNGKLIGEETEWTEKGLLKSKNIFKDGYDNYTHIEYDSSEKIIKNVVIKKGKTISGYEIQNGKKYIYGSKDDPFSDLDKKQNNNLRDDAFGDDGFGE